MNASELRTWLEERGLDLPEGWNERIETLGRALREANRARNLTRIDDREAYLLKHVADSLLGALAWPPLGREPLRVADIGCGAGFPGLPLAITNPRLEVIEIDSVARKIDGVRAIVTAARVENARPLRARGREAARAPELRESFPVVLARAVGSTRDLVRECHRLLCPDGAVLISYKTPSGVAAEAEEVERAAERFGLRAARSPIYTLPRNAGRRQLWLLER